MVLLVAPWFLDLLAALLPAPRLGLARQAGAHTASCVGYPFSGRFRAEPAPYARAYAGVFLRLQGETAPYTRGNDTVHTRIRKINSGLTPVRGFKVIACVKSICYQEVLVSGLKFSGAGKKVRVRWALQKRAGRIQSFCYKLFFHVVEVSACLFLIRT